MDWRKKQQTRADVRLCIEECLDDLSEKFETVLFQQKCEMVYPYFFDMFPGAVVPSGSVPAWSTGSNRKVLALPDDVSARKQ